MLAVGIGALQIVLDKGQQEDWFASTVITTLAVISAVTLVALVIHELTTDDPIVDLRVFKARSYARRRVPDDGASASCCTAAWCCCRSCCRRCSAIRRCRPASRWRRAASDRSS